MGQFGFFDLIKNYAEVTKIIDKNFAKQNASH